MVTYKINLKDQTIDFYNPNWLGDYYLPLEMFKIKENFCEGINHLSQKNWANKTMLFNIGKDLSKIYGCNYENVINDILNKRDYDIEFISNILKINKYGQ